MRQFLGRLADGSTVESVVVESQGQVKHCYLVVGGQFDGREFASLNELGRVVGRVETAVAH